MEIRCVEQQKLKLEGKEISVTVKGALSRGTQTERELFMSAES